MIATDSETEQHGAEVVSERTSLEDNRSFSQYDCDEITGKGGMTPILSNRSEM